MKPIYSIWIVLLIFLASGCQGQEMPFDKINRLSSDVNENSGLVIIGNRVITHNDSGDGPYLYSFDLSSPEDVKRTKLVDGNNTDWEDITTDGEYIYVFDTGTNKSKRKKMAYYRVPISELTKDETTTYEKYNFKFKNKNGKTKSINCEAVAYMDGQFFFLSKSGSGKTEMYVMVPGQEEAHYSGKIKSPVEITGIAAHNLSLYFCGYEKIGDNIYIAKAGKINRSAGTEWTEATIEPFPGQFGGQCEGIFIANETIYLSTELNLVSTPKLYSIALNKIQ